MPDENLIRTLDFLGQFKNVRLPSNRIRGKGNIQMSMWAMLMSKVVGPLTTSGHFYAFDGVQNQQTQAAVKNIQIQRILESSSWMELMGIVT